MIQTSNLVDISMTIGIVVMGALIAETDAIVTVDDQGPGEQYIFSVRINDMRDGIATWMRRIRGVEGKLTCADFRPEHPFYQFLDIDRDAITEKLRELDLVG